MRKAAGIPVTTPDQRTVAVMEKLLAGAAAAGGAAGVARGVVGLYDHFHRRPPLRQARRPLRSVLELPYAPEPPAAKRAAGPMPAGPDAFAGPPAAAAPPAAPPAAAGGLRALLAALSPAIRSLGDGPRPSTLGPQAPATPWANYRLTDRDRAVWGDRADSDQARRLSWMASRQPGRAADPTGVAHRAMGYDPGEAMRAGPGADPRLARMTPRVAGGAGAMNGRDAALWNASGAAMKARQQMPHPRAAAFAAPAAAAPKPAAPAPGATPPAPAPAARSTAAALTSRVGFGNLRQRARFQARGGADGPTPAGGGIGGQRLLAGTRTALGPTPNALKTGTTTTGAAAGRPAPIRPLPGPPAPAAGSIPPRGAVTPPPPPAAAAAAPAAAAPAAGPLAAHVGIRISSGTMPTTGDFARAKAAGGESAFHAPARWLAEHLGLLRGGGPESTAQSWLNPAGSVSGWTMPWAWAAAPPLLAAGAYAGWKPVDAGFKWLRRSEDEDDLAEAKGRYEHLLREQALMKGAAAGAASPLDDLADAYVEKAADLGDLGNAYAGILAALASTGGLAGLYGGFRYARSGSSDKVVAEALKRRRQMHLEGRSRPIYLKPTPLEAPDADADAEEEGPGEEGEGPETVPFKAASA